MDSKPDCLAKIDNLHIGDIQRNASLKSLYCSECSSPLRPRPVSLTFPNPELRPL